MGCSGSVGGFFCALMNLNEELAQDARILLSRIGSLLKTVAELRMAVFD